MACLNSSVRGGGFTFSMLVLKNGALFRGGDEVLLDRNFFFSKKLPSVLGISALLSYLC